MFISNNDVTWETSKEWQEMVWEQVQSFTCPMIAQGAMYENGPCNLPDLRDVDLMLMGV